MKRHLFGGMIALYLVAVGPPGVRATSCPTGGAALNVYVYNPGTSIVPLVTVSGAYNWATCAGNGTTSTYSQTVTNLNPGETRPVTVSNVLTGVWTHHITFGTQSQYQNAAVLIKATCSDHPDISCQVNSDCPVKSTCVATSASNARVNWTAFPNVITVNLAGDNGTNPADCLPNNPATCTLRKAILRANQVSGASTPTLIQFTVSPGTMGSGALEIAGNGYVTIDGTDSNGNPWIVGDANAKAVGSQSPFPRAVDLAGVSFFLVKSSNNTIQGLDIMNSLPPTATPGGPGPTPTPAQQTNNLLFFRTPTAPGTPIPRGNQVTAVRINAGNAFNCPGTTCPNIACNGSRDGINVEGEGTGLGPPYDSGVPGVTIGNVEVLAGLDKGLKSAYGGWAVVRDSWVHNNYRGGIQATLGGHVLAERNLSEQAGFRDGDHAVVDCGANGLSSHASSTQLFTNANVSRNNMNIGAHVDTTSTLTASGDYICGDRYNGLGAADTPVVSGQGIAAVYNHTQGVYLGGFSSADFGGGPLGSTGSNFFGENAGSDCDFQNANPTPTPGGAQALVSAQNSQWANGSPRVCGFVDTTGMQRGADVAMSLDITPTAPTNSIRGGQTIRVLGAGFNADAGNPPPTPSGCTTGVDLTNSCCLKKNKSNTCSGTHTVAAGNCVELGGTTQATALEVTSVTPTTIVTQVPGSSTGGWSCIGAYHTP